MRKMHDFTKIHVLPTLRYGLVSIAAAVLAACLLLVLVCSLPDAPIRSHIAHSMDTFSVEGDYFNWGNYADTELDMFTDALMLNIAAAPAQESALQDAMLTPYATYDDAQAMWDNTQRVASGDTEGQTLVAYPRYWHGYLIWLRPLLLFFTYGEIRVIMMTLQLILLMAVCFRIREELGRAMLLPLGAGVFLINPISTALSFQFACVYTIMLSGLLVLLQRKHHGSFWKVFLWIGVAVAFFDLLTYPVAALGIPLIYGLILKKDQTMRQQFRSAASWTGAFFCGYVLMWGSKWIVSWLLTGYNTVADAKSAAQFRLGTGEAAEHHSIFEVWHGNLAQLGHPLVLAMLLVAVLLLVLYAWRHHLCPHWNRTAAIVLLVGFYPLIWYAVLRQHSVIHSFFTYRNLAVSACALTAAVLCSLTAGRLQAPRIVPEKK